MSSKYLSVSTVPAGDDAKYHVYWKTEQMSGRLDIRVELDIEDRPIVAELWALRHLLLTAEVTGTNRTGENLELYVSHGAIRKLLMKKSTKKHLIPFTSWMSVRFRDVKITVPKKPLEVERIQNELESVESLTINNESDPDDISIAPVLGAVKVTQHAIDRYVERTGVSSTSRAWRSVLQLAKYSRLQDAPVPKDVELRKRQKHQDDARIMNSMNNWQLVFTPNDKTGGEPWVLVTIYQRPGSRAVA